MRTALLLVAALLSSGCISALAADHPDGLPSPTDSQAPTGPGAGTPALHGPAQRAESGVTVTLGPDGYTAAKDVTVRNDFGGAANARLVLDTVNGAVTVASWQEGGYRLLAHLEGKGTTEQEARAALDTMAVANQDALTAGLLEVGLQVKFNDAPSPLPVPPPVPLPEVNPLRRSASIQASLPAAPALDLRADTTNGAIQVGGLHGPKLDLDTTNGDLQVAGAWDKADLSTTNGAIRMDGLFNDLDADTTNGNIGGTVESGRSCKQDLDTTNGNISLKVRDAGHGYSIKGDTTNGRVTIDVAGAHASGDDERQATTPGYDDAAVQVRMSLESTNGNVSVRSA